MSFLAMLDVFLWSTLMAPGKLVPEDLVAEITRAPIYRKEALVSARRAAPGEAIDTILADGRHETSKAAGVADWAVTNPDGEMYLVDGDVFGDRYAPTSQPGVFAARGFVRAMPNPTAHAVRLPTSWG